MSASSPETSELPVESNTDKLKNFVIKHKTTIALSAALAVSVTVNVIRKPMPKIADATWYALTHEDVTYLNRLLENDPDFTKF
jgi:hypothetical protein